MGAADVANDQQQFEVAAARLSRVPSLSWDGAVVNRILLPAPEYVGEAA